jgi:hypothetical protein
VNGNLFKRKNPIKNMNTEQLKEIIIDQNKERAPKEIILRENYQEIQEQQKNKFIIILSGLRRSGKSTLLNELKKNKQGYFLNFDDDRLATFKLEDFQKLFEAFLEIDGKKETFYFDEIQNIPEWERFIRRLQEENYKIFITGSNASMLSKELGTRLTGRYLEKKVFPFSFKEYLLFKKTNIPEKITTREKIEIQKQFLEYLEEGGLPEYLYTKNKDYLRNLYDSILYRDIIARYKLTSEKTLKELIYFSANSISKEISFNSIKKTLGIGSSTTIKDYFSYLENSYLLFLIPKFDYSLKKQLISNKKIYLIDNALAISLGYRFSEDKGRLLENMVAIELKRRNKEIYYFQENSECDFIIKEKTKITETIQVCYELNNENKERELKGLTEAMKKFNLKQGKILTLNQEEEINIDNLKIKVLPVWKWLLINKE